MIEDSLLIWHSAGATDVGRVRTVNEDAFLDLPELGLWVVADGMGGHEAGDMASQLIIDNFRQLSEPDDLNEFIYESQQLILRINRSLRETSEKLFDNRIIGSTIVVLLLFDKQCACLWAGDSRLYRLRNKQLEQITRDHTMVEEYVNEGVMRPEVAYTSRAANALTQAVGAQDELHIDMKIDTIQDGDTFLLCSDGLYREVPDDVISQLISNNDSCSKMLRNLLERALSNGAKDNITASVVQIRDAYSETNL